jgi:hypothetical protein
VVEQSDLEFGCDVSNFVKSFSVSRVNLVHKIGVITVSHFKLRIYVVGVSGVLARKKTLDNRGGTG